MLHASKGHYQKLIYRVQSGTVGTAATDLLSNRQCSFVSSHTWSDADLADVRPVVTPEH